MMLRAPGWLALLGAAAMLFAPPARAALTSSEKGQIKDFVAGARLEDAGKVRSLVARTDLANEESTAALSAALTPVAFTDARGVFLKELVFGGASGPSRPILALATVRALLARADTVYSKNIGGLDHEPAAITELVTIYGWLDAAIANAGQTTPQKHDVQQGISPDSYETAAKAIEVHIKANARWLEAGTPVPATVGRVRAQAEIAFVDMLPDGLTRRVDAATRLGLQGARKALLITYGTLFADNGNVDEARVGRVQSLFGHLPAARADVAVLYAGENTTGKPVPLRARGTVVYVAPGGLWPFAGPPAESFDSMTGAVTYDLSVLIAKRALAARNELRVQADDDGNAATGDANRLLGRPRAPSVEHVLGGAIQALLTDTQIALDVAAKRFAEGRPESAALLADAVGALAVVDGKDAATVEVGKAGAWVTMSAIKLGPNHAATGFSFDGHAYAIDKKSFTKDKAPYVPLVK